MKAAEEENTVGKGRPNQRKAKKRRYSGGVRDDFEAQELKSIHTGQSMIKSTLSRLQAKDFNKCGISLAKYLLGKNIIRVLDDGEIISARIVETEAYLGEIDKACHTFGGKQTKRTEPMFMAPGTLYVYFIYGMYFCLNISSQDPGGCVLVRALEPIKGKDTMRKLRSSKSKSGKSVIKDNALCNGPSKLCTALAITKENLNKENLATSNKMWIENDGSHVENIVMTKRIGVDSYGQEWASKPYRFYIFGNNCISVKDKAAEQAFTHEANE